VGEALADEIDGAANVDVHDEVEVGEGEGLKIAVKDLGDFKLEGDS